MPLRCKRLIGVKENKKTLQVTGNPIRQETRDKPISLLKGLYDYCLEAAEAAWLDQHEYKANSLSKKKI